MAGNHYLVNWDLLRLAVFGKNAIDGNKLSGNLAIHVIGEFRVGKKARTSPFIGSNYMLMDLYIMTELDRLQCPMSVMEVPAYITNFSRLKNVIHTFENLCKPDNNNDDISWRRGSLTSTDVMFVLDKKKDRKRKNTTGHYTLK
ncbi:hypothetical protein G6F29_007367 [Rhizopus arrhizus]|nr:hypothetical protein G6F29_007367 [Rhizopus arrhizus]KAG0993507.1 hypothetical protein G6F28_006629 [Rhizopus arrhizus]KAG1007352.1 hypothetical protein G6F27_007464 [Rhizopus arrhizus]KAG1022924.1 hypothetical protein G6F26_007245 [Rhizopus arrhizus]KAG1044650.1 hypothetical protein G6F25_001448 [Rhizopus arrhizus]